MDNPMNELRQLVIDTLCLIDEEDSESSDINSKLENISIVLQMIAKNVIFSETGIFDMPAISNDEERQIQESFNMCVVNQLTYLTTMVDYERLNCDILLLQENMLDGSFLKLRCRLFFEKLVLSYIAVTNALINSPYHSDNPIQITQFKETKFDLSTIFNNCIYKNVICTTWYGWNNVAANNVRLFTHILSVLHNITYNIDDKESLLKQSIICVLKVLSTMGIHVKTLCIKFMTNLWQLNSEWLHRTGYYDITFRSMMYCIQFGYKLLKTWKDYEVGTEAEVTHFFQAVIEFIQSAMKLEIKSNTIRNDVIKISFDIIQNKYNDNVMEMDQFHEIVIALLGYLCKSQINDIQLNDKIFELFDDEKCITSGLIALLECNCLEELKIHSTTGRTISILNRILENNLHKMKCSQTNSDFIKQLEIFRAIVQSVCNIEHNYCLWHQIQHITQKYNQTDNICNICNQSNAIKYIDVSTIDLKMKFVEIMVLSKFENVTEQFLEIIKTGNNIHDINSIRMISEICCQLLELVESQIMITDTLQIKLFQCALSILPINSEYQDEFSIAFQTHFNGIDMSNINQLLNQLVFVNFSGLGQQTKTYFENRLWTSIYTLLSKDNINEMMKLIEKLLLNSNFEFNIQIFLVQLSNGNELQQYCAAKLIRFLICLTNGDTILLKMHKKKSLNYHTVCNKCDKNSINEKRIELCHQGLIISHNFTYILNDLIANYFELYQNKSLNCRFILIQCLPSFANHCAQSVCQTDNLLKWIELFDDNNVMIQTGLANVLNSIGTAILNEVTINDETKKHFFLQCLDKLQQILKKSISKLYNDHSNNEEITNTQSCIVKMIKNVGIIEGLSDDIYIGCFRLLCGYTMAIESNVAREAVLNAIDICKAHYITPKEISICCGDELFKLLVLMSVRTYCCAKLGIKKSLYIISSLFDAKNVQTFIFDNYQKLVTFLVPWCVKKPMCVDLLTEICSIVNGEMVDVLSGCFLEIYQNSFIYEKPEIHDKCITFVLEHSNKSLRDHLKDNLKTISEILTRYHIYPEFVMKTLRIIINEPSSSLNTVNDVLPVADIAKYISSRFLGVLTHFGQILDYDIIDKKLQHDTLLSLGEIIRFMGSDLITPFRFKFLSVLKSATERPALRDTCVQIWKIFIHTIDIQSLGPLLNIIVISLESFMLTHSNEINEILTFLLINNSSLLSIHISDLFFIDDTQATQEIKTFVIQHSDSLQMADTFMKKFNLYLKHAMHDNINVRIYGLKYITRLFRTHRKELNDMIIGQQNVCVEMEKLLNVLLVGCRHADAKLQLVSANCLGIIGAIEPSQLSTNYAPQSTSFALTIHSDEFAIMALGELCRATNLQKDSNNIDSFSVAIQEILLISGVNLTERRKLNVWQAIPVVMRSLMEPLLTSGYVVIPKTKSYGHPIYKYKKFTSCELWAFQWASTMIDFYFINENNETTHHLFKSFKSAMRNDANVLMAFLPYLLLHVIQSTNEINLQKIYDEFECIFDAVIYTTTNDTIDDIITKKCAKIVFQQFDFLDRWMYSCKNISNQSNGYQCIEKFIAKFDKKLMATINFNCGEYARALMYIELYINDDKQKLQSELSFLSKIYAELLDTDSLEGALAAKQDKLTLAEEAMMHMSLGRLQASIVCYEKMMQNKELSSLNAISMMQCYLGLDQPEIAIRVSESLWKEMHDNNVDLLLQAGVEPLWRLGRWDEMDSYLDTMECRKSQSWPVRCGETFLSFRKYEKINFFDETTKCQLSVLNELRLTSDEQSAYNKGYPLILKLHLITEIEGAFLAINNFQLSKSTDVFEQLFDEWNGRLELLQPTSRIMEPVLCLRRIVLNESKILIEKHIENDNTRNDAITAINQYIGKLYIKSIELAQNAGLFQQAQAFILNAENYETNDLFIEKAKLFWQMGDQRNSLNVLDRGIKYLSNKCDNNPNQMNKIQRQIYAEGKFLIATYNAKAMNTSKEINIKLFDDALIALKESEKCLVNYAQYLERVLNAIQTEPIDSASNKKASEYQYLIMKCYGRSMLHGCRYIYQSMPRVLSVWLDFQLKESNDKQTMHQMNILACQLCDQLPSFIFFTTFSQLISRICHPNPDVFRIIKRIIIKLILNFPQQSLWMLLSVYNSTYANRVEKCTQIFNDKHLNDPKIQQIIRDFKIFARLLIELTNKDSPDRKSTINNVCPGILKIFTTEFTQILLPVEKMLQPVLPAINDRDSSVEQFNAFPHSPIYIKSIKNYFSVMPSLQKPKRITMIGSDGRDYDFMLKPNDDLRIDLRLMEFNAVVKQYLRQDPEARQHRLYIRTYAVTPLSESCGILEWVYNLQTYKAILDKYYKELNLGMTRNDNREYDMMYKMPRELKCKRFKDFYLPKHPAVFREWFHERFTTPHNWYQARTSYIRTTAVMSIVGYILGLGDRHGENILFDTSNGDTVHVDFNCLFNRGESFAVPEAVPFRLTHNMVNAMGPLGVDGFYRKCSEITLKVLQEQKEPLMSVLKPLVYDPLVSWNRKIYANVPKERTDDQAKSNLKRIDERLKGFVKIEGAISNLPLSTDGVVNHTILEATNESNLACMYLGWSPFF